MANFFKSVLKLGEQSVTQPFRSIKEAAHGDFKGGFNDLFHSASKAGQDVAHSVGIRGWVGDHPMQSVGALVATIFGGWAAWGAYGAGAAGGATGAATGAGSAGVAGSAGGSTVLGGGVAASNGIAAGTAIGQTVPAIPSVASMTSGTGAAVTASPSYSILAAPGYGTGGSFATTLGGEVPVANTGFTGSSGSNWVDRGRQIQQMMNQKKGQGQQSQTAQPEKFLNNSAFDYLSRSKPLYESPTDTATDVINGLKLNTEHNETPDFTHGGTFGGFN